MRVNTILRDRLWLGVALIAAMVPAAVAAQTITVARSARAPEMRLVGDQVVLPFVMVREFPFVQGEIAGVKGKFMLDTGMDQAVAVNDHRVPLVNGQANGTGHFGSGQTFQTRMNPIVNDIGFGALHYEHVTQVPSQDATQLEKITPDFIGWIGYYFWQGYAMKLDYVHGQATFYRGSSAVYLSGEKVIAAIPFETRKLPNHPLVNVRIGKLEALAAFDTGQYGTLFTDEQTKNRLVEAGVLTKAGDAYNLSGVTMNGMSMPDTPGIDVRTSTFTAAEPIGIGEKNILTIGYGFLRQYKTVWDYRSHLIYLLAR